MRKLKQIFFKPVSEILNTMFSELLLHTVAKLLDMPFCMGVSVYLFHSDCLPFALHFKILLCLFSQNKRPIKCVVLATFNFYLYKSMRINLIFANSMRTHVYGVLILLNAVVSAALLMLISVIVFAMMNPKNNESSILANDLF